MPECSPSGTAGCVLDGGVASLDRALLSRSCAVDGDVFHSRSRLRSLRHRHGEYAVLESGGRLVLVDVLNRDVPFETAVVALTEKPVLILRLGLLLAFDGKESVRQFDLDVALIEAGQFCGDPHIFVSFADLDVWPAQDTIKSRLAPNRARSKPRKTSSKRRFTSRCRVRTGLNSSLGRTVTWRLRRLRRITSRIAIARTPPNQFSTARDAKAGSPGRP